MLTLQLKKMISKKVLFLLLFGFGCSKQHINSQHAANDYSQNKYKYYSQAQPNSTLKSAISPVSIDRWESILPLNRYERTATWMLDKSTDLSKQATVQLKNGADESVLNLLVQSMTLSIYGSELTTNEDKSKLADAQAAMRSALESKGVDFKIIASSLDNLKIAFKREIQYILEAEPVTIEGANQYFDTKLIPNCSADGICNSFVLEIKNKSDKNIELNWNKTLYIHNGQTSGGFMFEGVLYAERNNPKSPDILFSKSTFLKEIYPNNLVEYVSGRHGSWNNKVFPLGENGIFLTLVIDDKEVTQKLTTRVLERQVVVNVP